MWTDESSTLGDAWPTEWPAATNVDYLCISATPIVVAAVADATVLRVNSLADSYHFLGATGYEPPGVPNPIANNIDEGGGGGSTRPSSGLLYPRGTS